MTASASLQASVIATHEAGEKEYEPDVWQSLKSKIATDWTQTSTTNEPICVPYDDMLPQYDDTPPMQHWSTTQRQHTIRAPTASMGK